MAKPKLKIGLVFDDSLDSNDGVQQYVRIIGRWMLKQGHEVRFLVGETHDAKDLQPYVHSLSRNVRVSGNQNKMFLPFFAKGSDLQKVLDSENFDVLHVMTPFNPIMGQRIVMKAKDEALVSQFHMVGGTWFINNGGRLLSWAQKRALNKFNVYLGVSRATKVYAKKYFGIDLTVSPNAVDITPFSKGKPKPFLRGQNGTIAFLGRLVDRKGCQHLLQAIRIMHQHGQLDGVRVNIFGDGELRPELEAFVETHGLGDNVIFHGFIDEDDKADFLASADVVVFPSTGGEAFGIVLVEAMATGKSVVLGGDNAGYRTVLEGYEDLLFDPLNHEQLAAKIDFYLKDAKAAEDAIAWQNHACAQYDIEVVGRDVEKHYYEALRKKHAE